MCVYIKSEKSYDSKKLKEQHNAFSFLSIFLLIPFSSNYVRE